MTRLSRPLTSVAALFYVALAIHPAPVAEAAANHVVIGEYATRGPWYPSGQLSGSSLDEFIELYNPTERTVDLSGWRLQYKAATGTTWGDRAFLPGGATIRPRGFFLIRNDWYYTNNGPAPVDDFHSARWGSGMSDPGGHSRILDSNGVEVDKVGWGSALDAEGNFPADTMYTDSLCLERKAFAYSTAASMAPGGADELLGNGEDSDSNGNDFVKTSYRHPQNSSSPQEPAFQLDAGALLRPHDLSLSQNYPNPFVGTTHIPYAVPTAQRVLLRLYDLQGRTVRTLVNDEQLPGRYVVTLEARGLATGLYFCRLESGGTVTESRLLLLR